VLATLRPYHARLRTEIQRYGGTVEKFIGDAVMAVFGAPVGHEDDPERAVRAGLRIIEALAELNDQRGGNPLAVRVAVNTGEAIVTLGARPEQGEGMVAGDVVNVASRLQQVAPVGSVVVGEGTWRATSQMIDYQPMDAVEVKGKIEPISIWRATQAHSRYAVEMERPTTLFIGRDSELDLLRQAYRRMIREESVQLVTVTGEPGVGKSRLIGEFFAWADGQPELFFWRHGRCMPYGDGVTFWALGEIIKAQAGILENDAPDEADAKLRQAVELVVEDAGDRDWLTAQLAPLVGSRPDSAGSTDRAEAFSAWRAFLEAMAAFRPLILVIEDLHWADDTMLEFVEYLGDWATGVPMLVLSTARPELYERKPDWGGGKRNSTTVGLAPLQADEIAALVSSLLEETLLPAPTQATLLERAGGNPLYAEEFVRMLTDRGILQRKGRAWQIAADGDIPVPDTVQALIAARMDTLSPGRKALLHDAAVIGRIFWPGALSTMGGSDRDDVVSGLHDLLRKELVRPVRRSSMQGEEEFTFWHILVRDVAYAQIPRAQRAARHRKAAEWIEQAAGERVADHADILAHHYLQALELGGSVPTDEPALRAAASRYLYLAGTRASPLDKGRAVQLYRQALELADADDPGYPEIRLNLGGNLTAIARHHEAVAELAAAEAAFAARGEIVRAAYAMTEEAVAVRFFDPDRAYAMLIEAREILETHPPGQELVRVYAALSGVDMVAGRYRQSGELAQKAIDLAEKLDRPALAVRPLQYRGMARWDQGDNDGAKADLEASIELGQRLGESVGTAVAYTNYGGLRWAVDGPEAGLETYEQAIAFAAQRGMDGSRLWSSAEATYCLYELGRWDEVLETAESVAGQASERNFGSVTAMSEPSRIRVLLGRGRLVEAASAATSNLIQARHGGEPQMVIPALEVQAWIDLQQGHAGAAIEAVTEIEQIAAATTASVLFITSGAIRIACIAKDLALARRLANAYPIVEGRSENLAIDGQAAIAEAESRLDDAVAGFHAAAVKWASQGNVIQRGFALMGEGRSLVAAGRAVEAVEPLSEARDIFAGPGAVTYLAEIDDLLGRTAARAG
jgi:tetratricopeptide (TPR) repeat protein